MNNKFDELAKGVAQSVTRRQALKQFTGGIAGMALAFLGLSSKADPEPCLASGAHCSPKGQKIFPSCKLCCSGSFNCHIEQDVGERCFCN